MSKRKLKKYSVGLDSETLAVSFVTEPAIEETFVALKKEKEDMVYLSTNEKHMCYGAVCVPDKEIYRNDASGEYTITFSKESIEKMSQNFMKNYRQGNVTLQHQEEADNVTMVESWIKTDMEKDKSVALGLNPNLPIGTWFAGYKVNDVDVWERVKSGELRGYSIEAVIEVNELNFNADEPDAPTVTETVEAPVVEETPVVEEAPKSSIEDRLDKIWEVVQTMLPKEPKVEEVKEELEPVQEEKPIEEVKPQEEAKPNPLDEVVKNLQAEIETLKANNSSLLEQIKAMGTEPSVKPVNTNATGSGEGDTFRNWRDQMGELYR